MPRLVRHAQAMDGAALGRVHVECWRETYAHILSAGLLGGLDPVARGEQWERFLAKPRPEHRVSVLEVDGEIRGFAMSGPSVEEPPARDIQLYSIYQYASEHGLGGGQLLLDAVIGTDPAELWVAEHNPRAIAFYRRNGFELDGTQKFEPDWENLSEVRMLR